ncbi:MAG: NAD-dependent deacylase [Bacteroidales bacterium]|nr:NAD-dependent deacylase [Bacteroidales bacterium]
MKNIVVLTGAGISAESGVPTFRDSDGLWCNYHVEDVATHEAWERNPQLVNDFYNQRRKQLYEVEPNAAHYALVKLEDCYNVTVVTQNIDDLHERAGSKNIIHLHGELKKVRSTKDPDLIYDLDGWELKYGTKCELGSILRPHIVFFNEAVPNMEPAMRATEKADIIIVIGTSLQVYPAASLLYYAPPDLKKYLVDPKAEVQYPVTHLTILREKATLGVPQVVETLLNDAK